MTPLLLTLSTGEELYVLMQNSTAAFEGQQSPDILSVQAMNIESTLDESEIAECTIQFTKGTTLICHVPRKSLARISSLDAVINAKETMFAEYAKMQTEENALDLRVESVKQFVNNFPKIKTRAELHRQYLKRKAAYVAALEALVDSSVGGS